MFTLTIETKTDAFTDSPYVDAFEETARILRDVARRLDDGDTAGLCVDANGKSVGNFGFSTLRFRKEPS